MKPSGLHDSNNASFEFEDRFSIMFAAGICLFIYMDIYTYTYICVYICKYTDVYSYFFDSFSDLPYRSFSFVGFVSCM